MSGKIEYLEKYSVAPSPSRDYYGIKVLQDEVILYLWKVSHGPHKGPIVRSAKFANFVQDKTLQDDIYHGFGAHILKHATNIARGKTNTLLTLPKCLIERISKYLRIDDIVNLSSLSHVAYEVFNANSLWRALYRRYCKSNISKYEEDCNMAYGWKQLFKEHQTQALINEQKRSQSRAEARAGSTKAKREAHQASSKDMPKVTVSSMTIGLKKSVEASRKLPTADAPAKRSTNVRSTSGFATTVQEKIERTNTVKKISAAKSAQAIVQKAPKVTQDEAATSKPENEREARTISAGSKSADPKSLGRPSRVQKTVTGSKTNISGGKASASKSKTGASRTFLTAKCGAMERNEAGVERSSKGKQSNWQSNWQSRQLKTKVKGRKIGQSKSTIVTTHKTLVADALAVRDDSFDLADLIEASVKNIRSPRSIFDYDFSCLDPPGASAGDHGANGIRKELCASKGKDVDRVSGKLGTRAGESNDSAIGHDTYDKNDKHDVSHFTAKYTKARLEKMRKSLEHDLGVSGSGTGTFGDFSTLEGSFDRDVVGGLDAANACSEDSQWAWKNSFASKGKQDARARATLDRLSEKSETTDSAINDDDPDATRLKGSYAKTRAQNTSGRTRRGTTVKKRGEEKRGKSGIPKNLTIDDASFIAGDSKSNDELRKSAAVSKNKPANRADIFDRLSGRSGRSAKSKVKDDDDPDFPRFNEEHTKSGVDRLRKRLQGENKISGNGEEDQKEYHKQLGTSEGVRNYDGNTSKAAISKSNDESRKSAAASKNKPANRADIFDRLSGRSGRSAKSKVKDDDDPDFRFNEEHTKSGVDRLRKRLQGGNKISGNGEEDQKEYQKEYQKELGIPEVFRSYDDNTSKAANSCAGDFNLTDEIQKTAFDAKSKQTNCALSDAGDFKLNNEIRKSVPASRNKRSNRADDILQRLPGNPESSVYSMMKHDQLDAVQFKNEYMKSRMENMRRRLQKGTAISTSEDKEREQQGVSKNPTDRQVGTLDASSSFAEDSTVNDEVRKITAASRNKQSSRASDFLDNFSKKPVWYTGSMTNVDDPSYPSARYIESRMESTRKSLQNVAAENTKRKVQRNDRVSSKFPDAASTNDFESRSPSSRHAYDGVDKFEPYRQTNLASRMTTLHGESLSSSLKSQLKSADDFGRDRYARHN